MIACIHLILAFYDVIICYDGYRNRRRWVWEYGDSNDEDQTSGDRFPIDEIGEVRCYNFFLAPVV